MSDKFATLAEMVKAKVREAGGKISFKDLAEWAKNTEIGSLFVLYAIVKDMIDQGELVALEGYEELPELMMWQAPKVVALPQVAQEAKPKEEESKPEEVKLEEVEEEMSLEEYGKTLEEEAEKPKLEIDVESLDEDLKKALSYLSEYWSVGEIRFKLDLKRLGVQDPDKVLYKLLDMGVIDLTPSGVVNLKVELPKIKKGPSLVGFI
ncbi:MAG: PolB1-binding protein PBP2 family protein [Candidatus Nezhaarchaeales archaeon]